MLSYNQSFDKTPITTFDARLRRSITTMVPVYSAAQFTELEAAVVAELGEAFVSLQVADFYNFQSVTVDYNGVVVGDVETTRNEDLDQVFNTWVVEQGA